MVRVLSDIGRGVWLGLRIAVALIAGIVVVAGCGASAPSAPVRAAPTVTRTVQAAPRVVTSTVTVGPLTATVPPSTEGTAPCSLVSSGFLVIGDPGGNTRPEGICQLTGYGNDGNGLLKLTDSAGLVTWYTLGVPSS